MSKFFFDKNKPEFMSFLEDVTAFALSKFTHSTSLNDLKSSQEKSDEKKRHKKKKHSHKSDKAKSPDHEESRESHRKSMPPSTATAAAASAAAAPPLPPLPSEPGALSQIPSTVSFRRNSVPSRGDDLLGLFNRDGAQQQQQTPPESSQDSTTRQQPLVITRTTTTPVGTNLAMSMLTGGAAGSSATMISPRTANQLIGAHNSKKTIRKTGRMLRLNVDGPPEAAIPSLYGGPVSPEALTPRTALSRLASDAAPKVSSSLSPTTHTSTPSSSGAATVSGHVRQPSLSNCRNKTMYEQNLEKLCNYVNAHEETSLLTLGSVRSIVSVRIERKDDVKDLVYVVHNNPSPEGSKGSPSIAVYDCNTLKQEAEVKLPDVTINNIVFAGKFVWLATSEKDLICISVDNMLRQHMLKGHSESITDVANMGKTVWTIGEDLKIGVWEVSTMKLRKMIKDPSAYVLTCIIHVEGKAWIGTAVGIQRYDLETLKMEKDPEQFGEATRYLRMHVSKLLLVNNCVWALHHDENMVSVWSSDNKIFLGAFSAVDVVSMLHVGQNVWMTSHNHYIRCFETSTFSKVGELSGMHQDWVTCMAIAKHNDSFRVWSGSTDATVAVWDANITPHNFVPDSSLTGVCEACKKPFKRGCKKFRCKVCQNVAVHDKCLDLLSVGCGCAGGAPSDNPKISATAKL